MTRLPEEPMIFKFRRICFVAALAGLSGLAGCGKFFPPLNPPCTSNCTTTTNFMYVANSTNTTASPASMAGFSLTTTTTPATETVAATSTLTLAVTPNSAYTLGYVPTTMVVTPANKYMYVGSLTGGIYLYAVNSDGSITLQNNSTAVAAGIVSAMKVDSTGTWLITVGANLATTNAIITVYKIASTTGLLTSSGTLSVSKPGASDRMVIVPNNVNVFVTLGTGGTEALTFNATTGVLADVANLSTLGAANADHAITTDPNSTYAFITETGSKGLRVMKIGTTTILTEVAGSPFQTGLGPSGVLVDASGSYVYVTNQTDNTISGYVLAANGTVTEITGSPYATGTTPVDIAEDASKTYVGVACNGGGQDLEVYSFDAVTGGKLDAAANATTGTDPTLPIAITTTH